MRTVLVAGFVAALLVPTPVAAQDTLAAAKDLYVAASYEEALAVLDRLKQTEPPPAEIREIEQYRAFCLLALKRQGDAEKAIESLVVIDPFFRPQEGDAAPWIRSSFRDVRRRTLPGAVQRLFQEARATYGRKEYTEAAESLRRVLAILEDPDLAPLDASPTLTDLRVLAGGFLELSEAAIAAAAAPPSPQPGAPPSQPSAPADASGVDTAASPRIYSAADADVTAPTPIFQGMPRWPSEVKAYVPGSKGVLEIVIDEAGQVASAQMRQPLNLIYDAILVAGARSWSYKPAMKDGQPVKYRRLVEVVAPAAPVRRD